MTTFSPLWTAMFFLSALGSLHLGWLLLSNNGDPSSTTDWVNQCMFDQIVHCEINIALAKPSCCTHSAVSRISQRECQPHMGCANLFFGKTFAENCIEMKEIGTRTGTFLWNPLDPPMIVLLTCDVTFNLSSLQRNVLCTEILQHEKQLLTPRTNHDPWHTSQLDMVMHHKWLGGVTTGNNSHPVRSS